MKKYRLLATILVVLTGLIMAGTASAKPQATQSSNTMGYCGPGISSKGGAVAYYANHPGTAAERYMRSNPPYYHIRPDQSFASYLNNPHVKYFAAPAGYKLKSNTYCPTNNSIAPYSGRLSVGGVYLLWWCKDVRGYGCTPIAKGYCNNIVMGKMIRPVPKKPVHKPKKKVVVTAPAGSCNITISGSNITINGEVNNCSTFTTIVTCGNVSQTFSGADKDTVAHEAQTWQQANCNTPAPPVVVPPPVIVTPPPVTFTASFDTINFIPGGACRPETLHVTSSVAGQIQVSPSNGLISTVDCYQPPTGQLSLVKLPVSIGSQDLTVYVYEPTDQTVTSDTLSAVPLITGVDAKNNTATTSFTVSHTTRP